MTRAAKVVTWLVHGLLVALLGLMVVLVFGNVVLRYGFNSGIVFSEEASRFVFMWLTALGAVLALHEGAHLGMTSLVNRLSPLGQRLCHVASDLVVAICAGVLAHGAWKQVVLGMSERAPVTGIPMGWVYGGLLVCATAMAVLALLRASSHAYGLARGVPPESDPSDRQSGVD